VTNQNEQHKHASRLLAEAKQIVEQPMTRASELFDAEKKTENALCIIRGLRLEATGQPRPKVGD